MDGSTNQPPPGTRNTIIATQTVLGDELDQDGVATRKASMQDEERPLLGDSREQPKASLSNVQIASIIAVILLGEFLGSMDGTLVTAAGPTISSKFGRLEYLNWLTTAYMLGVAVVQPSLGKLSDIFGRKYVLLTSYFLFALGRVVSGLASSMDVVIVGRAIGGTGGAGMMTIASIVITDLVAKRDLAMWRSYVNLVMTLGRSLGGPIGGFLLDYLGWRWLFLSQVPFVALAFCLVAWKMNLPREQGKADPETNSFRQSSKRIDFLGSATTAISVVAGLILLDMGGSKFAWTSAWAIGLTAITVIFGAAFVLVEAYVAPEPVFSLHLLKNRDVVLSYLVMPLQSMAQMGMMFFVPLYFQVTARASNTVAGAHLVPAVAGNATGGLLAGYIIRRTGRFKLLAASAGLIGALSYVLLITRWQGHTRILESMYIIPGGFGMGICQSVIFVAMTAAIEPKDIAMATSGLFQTMNISVAVGLTAVTSLMRVSLQTELERTLQGPNKSEIIERVMSDITFVARLKGSLRQTVVSGYIVGLQHTYFLSLACALLSFLASLFLTDRQL